MPPIIITLLVLGYLMLALLAQAKVRHNRILNKKQKIINSILTWTIPFLWSIVCLINYRTSEKLEVITKSERKIPAPGNNSDGMPAGGDCA